MEEIEIADCEQTVTKFFTTAENNTPIFVDALNFLHKNGIENGKVSEGQWKLKYSFQDKVYNGNDVKVTLYISKIADQDLKVVEVVKTDGFQQAFNEHFKKLAEELAVYSEGKFSFE